MPWRWLIDRDERLDPLEVLGVLGDVLARRDQVGDERDLLAELGVLLEEQVECREPAQDVLGEVGAVDAEDQVLAAAAQDLALVLVDGRALRRLAEGLGRDRQRVGADPHLAVLEADDAGLLVDLEIKQVAAAEQEVAPVGAGVERDDVVGQDPLEDVLAQIAWQDTPGVGLGPRDVDEVVQEHVRPRVADELGRGVEVVVVEHHDGALDAFELLDHRVGEVAVDDLVAVLVGLHLPAPDVGRVREVPEVVLDEPQHRVRDHVVEAVVGLGVGLDEADAVGHVVELAVERPPAVDLRRLGVLGRHRRGHPEGVAVVDEARQGGHQPTGAPLRLQLPRVVAFERRRPAVGDEHELCV